MTGPDQQQVVQDTHFELASHGIYRQSIHYTLAEQGSVPTSKALSVATSRASTRRERARRDQEEEDMEAQLALDALAYEKTMRDNALARIESDAAYELALSQAKAKSRAKQFARERAEDQLSHLSRSNRGAASVFSEDSDALSSLLQPVSPVLRFNTIPPILTPPRSIPIPHSPSSSTQFRNDLGECVSPQHVPDVHRGNGHNSPPGLRKLSEINTPDPPAKMHRPLPNPVVQSESGTETTAAAPSDPESDLQHAGLHTWPPATAQQSSHHDVHTYSATICARGTGSNSSTCRDLSELQHAVDSFEQAAAMQQQQMEHALMAQAHDARLLAARVEREYTFAMDMNMHHTTSLEQQLASASTQHACLGQEAAALKQ